MYFAKKKYIFIDTFPPFARLFYYIISMYGKEFWGRAKPLIKALNLTQRQFAERLGMSYFTLRGWIYHERMPELSAAYDIALVLGVSLDFLISGKDKNFAERRLKEIELRRASTRLLKLTQDMQRELRDMRPL